MRNKIGIIGGGNMGAAIISGIVKDFAVSVSEKDSVKAGQLKKKFKVTVKDLSSLVKDNKVIVLAVKPQDFDQILSEIKPFVTANHLIISIAAGITTLYIEKRLGKVRVVRTMPNLPAQVAQAMTGIAKGKLATQADLALTVKIFNKIGKAVVVEEKLIDAITAVSGSGPAYVFLFVELMNKAALSLGLDPKISHTLVAQTLKGSLALLESQKEDASVLRQRVTSKGGTTQAALEVFEKNGLEQIFDKALKAARDRAKELSK